MNTFCELSLVLFSKLKDMFLMFFFIQIDKQLASGEYFLQEKERRLKAQKEKKVSNLKQTSEGTSNFRIEYWIAYFIDDCFPSKEK